jgi:hypothetical protein
MCALHWSTEIEHNTDEITSRSEKVHMKFGPGSPNTGSVFFEILLIDQKAMKIDFSKNSFFEGYTMQGAWIFEMNVWTAEQPVESVTNSIHTICKYSTKHSLGCGG